MSPGKSLLLILALCFTHVKIAPAQCLNGTYTIGGISPDYILLNDAVSALITNGVCGSVDFLIRDGSYPEQLTIPVIAGASATNTIRFTSESGDSTSVVINPLTGSSQEWAIKLDGTDHITFEKLTVHCMPTNNNSLKEGFYLINGSEYVSIKNCVIDCYYFTIKGPSIYGVGIDSVFRNNEFSNNVLIQGIQLYGSTVAGQAGGVVIKNNIITFGSLQISELENFLVTENYITADSALSTSAYISSCNSGGVFSKNQFVGFRNKVLRFDICNPPIGNEIFISNNFIMCGAGTPNDVLGLLLNASSNIKIYNNNIALWDPYTYVFDTPCKLVNSDSIDIRNNIFAHFAFGPALYCVNSTFTSDYNNLYSNDTGLVRIGNTVYPFLSDWQLTGNDANSFDYDPLFISFGDLHTGQFLLKNTGLPLAAITDDFDSEIRDATPDIGADEFENLTDSVWPGDANKTGLVDMNDLLTVGLNYGASGFARDSISNLWMGHKSWGWTSSVFNYTFPDRKHTDCNGDGTINASDTSAIALNFNLTHPLRTGNNFNNPSSLVAQLATVANKDTIGLGEQVTFEMELGNISVPIDSIYGLIFHISMSDPSLVDSNSFAVSYAGSFFGSIGNDMIKLEKYFGSSGELIFGITGIDHLNRNGYGNVLSFSFNAVNSLTSPQVLFIVPNNITAITHSKSTVVLNFGGDSVIIDPGFVSGLNEMRENKIHVYPNPAKEQVNFSWTTIPETPLQLSIFNTLGELVDSIIIPAGNLQYNYNITGLDAGVYYFSLKNTQAEFHYGKLVVAHEY
ncbi:MAG: T9SS type A sorting domain-containing protein [Chitinophagales bacterium]